MSDVVIRARESLEGVSDGPWRWEPSKHIRSGYVITAQNRTAVHACDWNADYGPFPEQFNHADANFAAQARTLVPELTEELERLREALAPIRAVLDKLAEDTVPPCDFATQVELFAKAINDLSPLVYSTEELANG